IGEAFRANGLKDVNLWPLWDAVRCPVLVLHGAESDLLLSDTTAEMRRRGPATEVVGIPGVGHAPALVGGNTIAVGREWPSATAQISPAPTGASWRARRGGAAISRPSATICAGRPSRSIPIRPSSSSSRCQTAPATFWWPPSIARILPTARGL